MTRSYNATNLLNGDTCYVWADMVNGSTQAVTEYFKAWTLIANGSGGLSPQVSGNTKLFPATNVLNFYALVGNFGKETEGERAGEPKVEPEVMALPETGILHTVKADQSTETGYYKSDLLYSVKLAQEPISEAVVLPFKHLLSRIQVVIVAGDGISQSDLTTNLTSVELLGVKQQVIFAPDKAADFTSQADLAGMLSEPANVVSGNITMAKGVVGSVSDATAPGSTVYADAIIVPQTFAANTQLIKVSYLGRDTYYTVPTGGMTFESGKQYRFRLIADRIGETYEINSVTMDAWGAASDTQMWFDNLSGTTTLGGN
jgi:hypothetical protein